MLDATSWTEARRPALALFLRVWLWDIILGPIIGVAAAAPGALPYFPILFLLSYGFPLMAAAIGATIHAALLASIVSLRGWPKQPLDVWRFLSIGLIVGAIAGSGATIAAGSLYGGFKGTGLEWHGALAGALCAGLTTVHGLRSGLKALGGRAGSA